MWRHFTTTTPVFNRPTLYYSSIGGNGPYLIRLRVTSYRIASETAKLQNVTALPAFPSFRSEGFNTSLYGSNLLIEGVTELPKLQMQGHIDTPATQVGTKVQSTLLLAGQPVSYGDVITTAMEGRAGSTKGAVVNPDYFVDAFGRVFSKPRITEFTASYMQGVPFRQNFNLTLQLTRGSAS